MTLFLVRHGETAYNRDGQGLGREDVPLTEKGERQARALGERFARERLTRVLSSPLVRALDVARAIAEPHGLTVEVTEVLTELDVGETEGMTFAEMRTRIPDFLAKWAGPDGWRATMPGGESLEDVARRLGPLIEEFRHGSPEGVVVVSHNFVLRALLCELLGIGLPQFRSFQLDLASVTALSVGAGRVAVRNINDTCHLSSLNLA